MADPIHTGASGRTELLGASGYRPDNHQTRQRNHERSLSRTLSHVVSLAFAEQPVKAHRDYVRGPGESSQTHAEAASARPAPSINNEQATAAHAQLQSDRREESLKKHRLWYVLRKNQKKPRRKQYVAALRRWMLNDYHADQPAGLKLRDGLHITLMRTFDWFTPTKVGHHLVWFQGVFLSLLWIVFGFMAGGYALVGDVGSFNRLTWGPSEFKHWLQGKDWRKFDDAYLVSWGAQYLPYMKSEGYRWMTAPLLHKGFETLLGNSIVLLLLGSLLEYTYGGVWMLLYTFILFATNSFIAGAVQADCALVYGVAAVAWGYITFYSLDTGFRWPGKWWGSARIVLLAVMIIVWGALHADLGVPQGSQVWGAILVGLCTAPLAMPNLKWELLELSIPPLTICALFAAFVVCLGCVYNSRIPRLTQCPAL